MKQNTIIQTSTYLFACMLFLVAGTLCADDFALVKERMCNAILRKEKISAEAAQKLIASQAEDGSWPDINYAGTNRSSWEPAQHLVRALDLAKVWADPKHPLHHDEKLGNAIRGAVNYWSTNRFRNSNFWWNDMFIPAKMTNILLVSPELFPEGKERDAALKVCAQSAYRPQYTGANLVLVANNNLRIGLIKRAPATVKEAADKIKAQIAPAPTKNKTQWEFCGIRADGCYHQHGPQIQFGNYGSAFLYQMAKWGTTFKDTQWAFSDGNFIQLAQLSDGFQWVLWNGRMDLLAAGRQLGRGRMDSKGRGVLRCYSLFAELDPERSMFYKRALERNSSKKNDLVGNRCFWNSDYMVHRRPGWYAAVRMNSVRVRPVEDDANGDNALGRYFSDGVMLIMRDGYEYDDITACWDWTRLPGTTLPATPIKTQPEEVAKRWNSRWTLSNKWRHLGESIFTGGVSDGMHGAAVYSMNLDGVSAKKAYFFEKDVIWLLGCDIKSASEYRVATTVNSCLKRGEIKQGKDWFWHDGIGYRGKGITLAAGVRSGDWRYLEGNLKDPIPEHKDIFNLTIAHGLRPKNATYEVEIRPGATAEETAAASSSKVLMNTPECQAVEFSDGIRAAVFYTPGKIGNFETDSPGAFLIGKTEVFAADPSQRLESFTLILNGIRKTVKLPNGELAGKSTAVEF